MLKDTWAETKCRHHLPRGMSKRGSNVPGRRGDGEDGNGSSGNLLTCIPSFASNAVVLRGSGIIGWLVIRILDERRLFVILEVFLLVSVLGIGTVANLLGHDNMAIV